VNVHFCTFTVSYFLLDERRCIAYIFADASEADEYLDGVHEEKRVITAEDTLHAKMLPAEDTYSLLVTDQAG